MSYIPRILIVDDEIHICESLKILLKRQGYDILTANTGREALEMLAGAEFDLLLLDMVIPDMNGFQIMDQLNSRKHDILTIVITGNASIESAVKALKKGAYDYLKKPFEYEELIKRVGNALRQKKLVHEKKIIHGELERSEERYQYLVQNSPDIIYTLDKNQRFSFVNVTVQRLLGYSPEQLDGKEFCSIVYEEDREKAHRFLLLEKVRNPAAATIELRLMVSENKGVFKLFAITHAERNGAFADGRDGGAGIYGVARDITYRKQLERQLQQAKKMEAIGTLAGGIAHDFNNILMGIMGYTSLLLSKTDARDPHRSKLENIQQHVTSGSNLTKQLLGFARGGTYNVSPVDINALLEKTSNMFGRTNREVSIRRSYQGDLWTAEVDEGQIEQVLLNLYVNAKQAMPDGGDLLITTGNTAIDEQDSLQFGSGARRYVKIEIRDTGIGMDEEIQQRIFEPFFTTKEMGVGTGLGLASAYGIIKNHGGTITVSSKKGQGTAFTIFLPASEKPATAKQEQSGEIMKGSGTILLVDDDIAMIDVGAEILATLGYSAITARSGKEALKMYAQNQDCIDAVIVDLIMPKMSGGELYDKLKAFDPQVKVLLSSGYSIDGEATRIIQRGCNGFIQKPFGLKELSQKIGEILQ